MNGEEDIDQVLKSSDTPEDGNENTSQEQAIEHSKTENMEVHAHDLHKVPGQGWKHYIFEFLMLFLAVFCGFLAENFREHQVENQREKEYAQSLYEDLKADTSILNDAIQERKFIIPKIDSFRFYVHTRAIGDIPSGTWYYFGRFGTIQSRISLQDATLQQLLSSGGLRYFRKQNVAYAIAQYDQSLRNLKENSNVQDLMYSDLVRARNVIFDAYYLDEIMQITISNEDIEPFKKRSFPLLSNKKEDFIQYANLCQLRSVILKNFQMTIESVEKSVENLLTLLKKEYHLN